MPATPTSQSGASTPGGRSIVLAHNVSIQPRIAPRRSTLPREHQIQEIGGKTGQGVVGCGAAVYRRAMHNTMSKPSLQAVIPLALSRCLLTYTHIYVCMSTKRFTMRCGVAVVHGTCRYLHIRPAMQEGQYTYTYIPTNIHRGDGNGMDGGWPTSPAMRQAHVTGPHRAHIACSVRSAPPPAPPTHTHTDTPSLSRAQ